MKGLHFWGAFLLLVSGGILLIPSLYFALSKVTGDRPWIQILLGVISVIVSLAMFAGKGDSSTAGGEPGRG